MSSIVPGFEYDIFISYRHKDNTYDGWVTEFVNNLRKEIEATFKEDITVYFDENPHDGLLETHDVDQSLNDKIKCLVFIPVVSQTYCDPKSFAWQKEFLAFRDFTRNDGYGLDVKLSGGNVAKRILPIRIHEIEPADKGLFEVEIGGVMRPIDFIFKAGGVNRPLREKDDNVIKDHRQPFYRDNINKVANAVKEIIHGMSQRNTEPVNFTPKQDDEKANWFRQFIFELQRRNVIRAVLVYVLAALLITNTVELIVVTWRVPENLRWLSAIILIIFFPVAATMAWLFERSPSGFVRYGTAQASNNTFNDYQRKPFTGDFTILILLGLTALAYFLSTGSEQPSNDGKSNVLKLSINLEHEPYEIAISQDGLSVVYSTASYDHQLLPLYIRNLNEDFSRPLALTEGAVVPFFSPDKTMVGFIRGNAVFKTSIEKSVPLKIAEISGNGASAFWSQPDTIIISDDFGTQLRKISATSGEIINVPINAQNLFGPSPVNISEKLLGSDEHLNIIMLSSVNGASTVILPNGGYQPKYMEPGYLLYALQGRLMATAFNSKNWQTTGSSIPVLSKVQTNGLGNNATYDISKDGTLIYSATTPDDLVKFVWVDETGIITDSLNLPANFYGAFSLSPDGTKVAYGFSGPNSEIWVFDLTSGQNQKLTDEGISQYPIWSPDGLWVTYSSYVDGQWDLYRQNFNATQQREKLTSTGKLKRASSWSPDGKQLTFYGLVEGEGDDMFMLSLADKAISSPWRNRKASDRQPRLSPDGRFMCYFSTDAIYVEPVPATGQRWQISEYGVDQIWSPSGDKIYLRADGTLYYVQLNFEKGFKASKPKEMFSGPFVDVYDRSFDVSKDGKRFLMLKAVKVNEHSKRLEIIVNWREELKKIVKNGNN